VFGDVSAVTVPEPPNSLVVLPRKPTLIDSEDRVPVSTDM
jgi:hypothetical protein